MLDTDTKRRINTCRDILVGKVPDPKSQVEQITIALIYKFMDDMDLESEEMGGTRTFFAGEFERYAWAKLVAPGVGGQEMLNTYTEALTKMVENPGIPELFRTIFRNAYLPYRDPETLRSFLREINGFAYDHSERLGDAFEYLLSVLGSQGDAGQFRTPRHIIDFMVDIIDPKKGEVILDPACGTAGFLISSYKHILKANSTDIAGTDGTGAEVDAAEATLDSPLRYAGDLLTPDDRQRLATNIKGYDISPDMVRLSLVNLYLHGFVDPKVEEYDTLTSDDKWGETADVILANPPFMSPKGGIKPHNRFGVASKRSEVLFVDYMAEHLNPNGRAAIVVPEGIIFQSQGAYCDLRRVLVEGKYLAAVISLPAGVFNPYSGVKTSILILDRAAAKASDSIAFFKIENDGFGLGAQRRAAKGSQLPQVKAELSAWLGAMRSGWDAVLESSLGFVVERARIALGGEYNLSAERYRDNEARTSAFPMLRFDDVCTLEYGSSLPKSDRRDGPFLVMGSNGVTGYHDEYTVEGPAIVVGRKGSAGEVTWVKDNCYPIDTTYYVKQRNPAASDLRYLYSILRSLDLPSLRGGAGIPGLNRTDVYEKYKIPLPPLEVQLEIVAEIEGYQKVIDGARIVLENYRPHIPIDPAWPVGAIKDIATTVTPPAKLQTSEYRESGQFPIIDQSQEFIAAWTDSADAVIDPADGLVVFGDHTCVIKFVDQPFVQGADGIKILKPIGDLSPAYLAYFLQAYPLPTDGYRRHFSLLKDYQVALPPLETQQAIVAEIEAERALVTANRELIGRLEKKIDAAIARVWGGAAEGVG
ncbi:N-6 DNA methylase [Novosphingobium sp.]|uniref:N-6 DNA methylase n=1 Tax=Novosphingobium sp. TaxID=1874826 RepID=UPI00334289FE